MRKWKKPTGIDEVNLAKLGRRTGLSRSKLRRLKASGFCEKVHGLNGQKKERILDRYSSVLDTLLKSGVSNSTVCLKRLQAMGFAGSQSTVKRYISTHKHLIPAKRQLVAPQGNRGRRYVTKPGETYQMDWGFTDVLDYNGQTYRVACFAMICHHCGQRYIEFFPNTRLFGAGILRKTLPCCVRWTASLMMLPYLSSAAKVSGERNWRQFRCKLARYLRLSQ